jgi:hypothetical protein
MSAINGKVDKLQECLSEQSRRQCEVSFFWILQRRRNLGGIFLIFKFEVSCQVLHHPLLVPLPLLLSFLPPFFPSGTPE